MRTYQINNIHMKELFFMKISVTNGDISKYPKEEIQEYVKIIKEKYKNEVIDEIILTFYDDGYVNIETHKHSFIPFNRIRRITGYLVGTLERFNDGKRAEERDRVKHDVPTTGGVE